MNNDVEVSIDPQDPTKFNVKMLIDMPLLEEIYRDTKYYYYRQINNAQSTGGEEAIRRIIKELAASSNGTSYAEKALKDLITDFFPQYKKFYETLLLIS